MSKTFIQQKNHIMRRVYYAYALRLITNPVATHGAVIAMSLFFLTYFVSFQNLIANFLNLEVRRVIPYFLEAVTQTEVWTLVLLGIIILAALSLRWRLHMPQVRHA